MVRAFVLYEGDVDPERYQQHIDEFVSPIPATFRHGKVVRAPPVGEQRFHHYAEFEFPDMDVVHSRSRTRRSSRAAGKDAAGDGHPVHASRSS